MKVWVLLVAGCSTIIPILTGRDFRVVAGSFLLALAIVWFFQRLGEACMGRLEEQERTRSCWEEAHE